MCALHTHTYTHILYTTVVKHASYTLTHAHTNSCTRTYGWCVYYICIILSEEQQQAHGRRCPSRNASTHYARAGQWPLRDRVGRPMDELRVPTTAAAALITHADRTRNFSLGPRLPPLDRNYTSARTLDDGGGAARDLRSRIRHFTVLFMQMRRAQRVHTRTRHACPFAFTHHAPVYLNIICNNAYTHMCGVRAMCIIHINCSVRHRPTNSTRCRYWSSSLIFGLFLYRMGI